MPCSCHVHATITPRSPHDHPTISAVLSRTTGSGGEKAQKEGQEQYRAAFRSLPTSGLVPALALSCDRKVALDLIITLTLSPFISGAKRIQCRASVPLLRAPLI